MARTLQVPAGATYQGKSVVSAALLPGGWARLVLSDGSEVRVSR